METAASAHNVLKSEVLPIAVLALAVAAVVGAISDGYRIMMDPQYAGHRSLVDRWLIGHYQKPAAFSYGQLVIFHPTKEQTKNTVVSSYDNPTFVKAITALPGDFFIVDHYKMYVSTKGNGSNADVNCIKANLSAHETDQSLSIATLNDINECLKGFSQLKEAALLGVEEFRPNKIVAGFVDAGHFLVTGSTSHSYDSRYIDKFGPISEDAVIGYARPLF